MSIKFKSIAPMLLIVLLAGCATNRSVVSISDIGSGAAAAPSNGKEVYISQVRDHRSFQVNPSTPNIPSLDASEDSSGDIKARAIGRKRNTYGKALGDIVLEDGNTVKSLTASAIRQAFIEKGYKVVDKPPQPGPNTYVVNADISQFWTWMNPGFWALSLSSEISTKVQVQGGGKTQNLVVHVKHADNFQTGTDGNYTQVISDALKKYIKNLKEKLK